MAAQEGKVDVVRLLLTEAQALINIQAKVHSHHITTSFWSTALSSSLLFACTSYIPVMCIVCSSNTVCCKWADMQWVCLV